jgi:thioesterase DpgC
VDSFAIGGGLQLLLVLDRVIAESEAYFTLPALNEGIIPGAANLRLSRLAGNRLARQLIFAGRRIDAADAQALLFCDEVVAADAIDERVGAVVAELANPAVVGNRLVLHLAEEPPPVFRQYMAHYSAEQSHRLYSPDLVENLERRWVHRARG